MKGSESRKLKLRVAQVAQRCSYYLYLNRKNKEWHHPPLLPGWDDDSMQLYLLHLKKEEKDKKKRLGNQVLDGWTNRVHRWPLP